MKKKPPKSETDRRAQVIRESFGPVSEADQQALTELQKRILECAEKRKLA